MTAPSHILQKDLLVNSLVPNTTGQLQGSCRVHASAGHRSFDSMWGTNSMY